MHELKLKLSKNKMSNACNNLNKQYKLVIATWHWINKLLIIHVEIIIL
jgi:hypothetical protein